MKSLTALKRLGVLTALCAAAAAAHADLPINLSLNFDNVTSGSKADDALFGVGASFVHFANPDLFDDLDAFGNPTGTTHWGDATATYGAVKVLSSSFAVSGANVLSNGHQPILIQFNGGPVDLYSFSVQQDKSGFGNPQTNGSRLDFLDAAGHVIDGASVFYTQYANKGLTISANGVSGVSGILLSGGVDYDNLNITTVSAVPEPASVALLLGGLGLVAVAARKRRSVA